MVRLGFAGKLIAAVLGLGALYLIATSLTPCVRYSLVLINQSHETIDLLSVRFNNGKPEDEIWRGRMEPGQKRHLLFDWPPGGSAYILSGRYNSRNEDFVWEYGYVRPTSDDTIVISDTGLSGFDRSPYDTPCSMADVLGCLKNRLVTGGFRELRCQLSKPRRERPVVRD